MTEHVMLVGFNIDLAPKIQGIYFINFSTVGINNTYKVIVVGDLVE